MGSLVLPAETADIETSSDDYARRFAGSVGQWFLDIQAQTTLRMLDPYRGASVLDVGGGHGQLTSALVRNGYAVTVLGSADECSNRIQPLLDAGQCSFKVGNVIDLPYPDQAFDVVASYRLLPHVTQWQRLLAELARVARVAVVLDYPTTRSVNYIAPQLFRFKKKLEGNTRPYTCFSEKDLLKVVRPLNFVRSDRYAEFFVPMVLHRAMKSPRISGALEGAFRGAGLTGVFGSPVILKLIRADGHQ